MANEFSRSFMPVSFENAETPRVDIYLRFHDDIADRWDNNANNTLRFVELRSILTNGPKMCYFQKAKADVIDYPSGAVEKSMVPLFSI